MTSEDGPEAKRAKMGGSEALVAVPQSSEQLIVKQPLEAGRTSSLAAATLQLTGHAAAVYTLQFNATGEALATGSFDKDILLWEVKGECSNYNVLKGHANAVLELKWSPDSSRIVSASADKTVAVWDANAGTRVRKCSQHGACVNSVALPSSPGQQLFASGGDDGGVRVWDLRSRHPVHELHHPYQILAVELSADGAKVFAGGIDNNVLVYDLAKGGGEPSDVYEGHQDTITGLRLSPDGKYLLSNGMDNTLRQWDVRPFVTGSRQVKVYQGAMHGSDRNLLRPAWSADGEMVSCGSSDRVVHIWDVPSQQELYYLPGHKATVNEVVFHPQEPVIASASSDKTVFIGELS